MAGYNAGSVIAKIELDTSEFNAAIKDLKEDIKQIKGAFNQGSGSNNGMADEIKKLKDEIKSLKDTTEDYKKQLKNLREQLKNGGFKDVTQEVKTLKEALSELSNVKIAPRGAAEIKQLKQALSELENIKIRPKGIEEFHKWWEKLAKTVKRDSADIKDSMEKFAQTNLTPSNLIVDESKLSLKGISNAIKGLYDEASRFSQKSNEIIKSMTAMAESNERGTDTFYQQQKALRYITTGLNQLTGATVRTTEVLTAFNFKLLDGIGNETIFFRRTTQLASAMQRMNSQGTANWQGRQTVGGYSNYISSINKINQALTRQAEIQAKLKAQQLDQYYAKVGSASTKYWNQIRQGTINLNTYKSNLTQITRELDKQTSRTERLATAQYKLFQQYHPNNLNYYKSHMNEINTQLERQLKATDSTANATKRGQMSMREFGTSMGKAEAYSNNLYRGLQKVRSVIVSFKTIMAAFGGMALWGFASDLIEGAKESYKAKSEIESLLNQNSHVSATGQKEFNEALDETVSQFKRINKYSLGETAASIGLEFNLNGKEMAKSLDAIAMIQSEYARAGRSNEEAALAVKDILQGEFRRLSMETGIGKEELTEKYGWNGNKEDIESLMDALRKAGKDRHWDLFAEKATSVGDIVAITQSRFGEFGADLISNIEPMLVSGFNGIIDIIDGLQKSFSGLSSFGKLTTIAGVGGGAFVTISTGLMMFKRNMGLAEIATLGWGKSFFTALAGLNKTDVALHGFRKTLIATISGTEAASLSNIGITKSLAARLLGVKANIAGEEGFLKAIMVSQGALRGESSIMTLTAASGLNLSQKLAAVTNNLSATEVQGMKTATAIRKIVTSTKLLRIAFLGLTSIAILSWFAGVVAYTDKCKKAMDNFNHILSNGSKIAKNTQKDIDRYTEKLSGLTEGTKKYNKVASRLETAKLNKKDIDAANELLKTHKKDYKAQQKAIDERRKDRFKDSLKLAADHKDVPLTDYENQMKEAIDVRNNALKIYDDRLYKASQHVNEHVSLMKEAGADEEKRLKYAREYLLESEQTAKLWKQFNEGDLKSGFYAVLSEAKLLWIDLWNNEHFVKFWDGVKKTWEDLKPTLNWLVKTLGDLGNILLDFFSTDLGRTVGLIGLFGGAIGLVGGKLGKFVTGSKSTIEFLGKLKDKLDIGGKKWKWWGDKAEEASKKAPKDSTGGITGDTDVSTKGKVPFREQLGEDAKKYARAAVGIFAGMMLITEAIVLLKAPMAALTELGWQYKQWEPDLRKGIEGLTVIAPVVTALLIPVIALCYVFDKFGVEASTIIKGAYKAAVGIAAGLFLVAEAIFLLNMPLIAIGSLGAVYGAIQTNAEQGIIAMRTVNDALGALVPWIPVFIGGIVLAAAASTGVGAIGLVEVAAGIAIGISLVTEAIFLLNEPLIAIATVGQTYQSLDGVKEGAEALKLTAEALTYVGEAMAALALVDISLLTQHISDIISQWTGINLGGSLTDLTAEGGVISQLNQFAHEFNLIEFEPIDQSKVQALAAAGDGVGTVGIAMQKVKTAMDNLPAEFKEGPQLNGVFVNSTNAPTDKASGVAGGVTTTAGGYFDTFKEPIRQLKDFVYEFNHNEEFNIEKVDTARLDAISQSADMITQINTAVENVKNAMQNVGNAQWETSYAEGGIFAAAGNYLYHATGLDSINNGQSSGSYKSSLGSSLQAMEDIISDMFTFQSNISKYGGGEGGEGPDVGGLSNMITIVQDAISQLSSTLSQNIPTIKENGKSLGSAIVNGFKEGYTQLDSIGSDIATKITTSITSNAETVKGTASTLGGNVATKFRDGVNPMSSYMNAELDYVNSAMSDRKDELGNTAYDLGSHIANRFKEGDDINSPGIMARSIQDEVGYIGSALSVNNLPQLAFDLANALSSNFNVDFNLSNIQLPDMSSWASKLGAAVPIVNDVKTQVSSKFEGMKTNVQGSFNSILSKTRSTMTNMKSATIGHIGNIKSSWHGMQTALISSADYIKTQTSTKIDKLKTNLGEFWNKVKHPDQLIGGSAGPMNSKGSIRRRSRPHMSVPKGNYAGSFNFKPKRNNGSPSDMKEEYLKCLLAGQDCYAGGWNFDWTNKISRKFKGWNTHFNKFSLDKFLNVGKFENSNFPVRGNAEVAKAYIYDVIRATTYGSYFNSHFGDDPVAALRAGVFNCWDGANIILAIARAFGFSGGMGHGSWDGIGHVWASIPGLGNIDATAIQNGYGFTSPKVKGYAGSIKRGGSSKVPDGETKTNNHNEVHIHIHGDVYGVDDLDSRIDEGANRVARQLFRDNYSGV